MTKREAVKILINDFSNNLIRAGYRSLEELKEDDERSYEIAKVLNVKLGKNE